MNTGKLVRMSNEIAAFFRPYPEAEAVAGIREHLAAFWTPRMRDAIAGLGEMGEGSLDPRVVMALRGSGQVDGPDDSPIEKAVAGPRDVGQLGSDAG